MKYYEIDENLARLSHEMMSFSDYKTGSETAEYRADVDKVAALAAKHKTHVSPYYHNKIDELVDRYAYRLANWYNAHNRNGASCPSVMICGAGNFPTRKKAKQNAREDSLWREYNEIKAIVDKIKSIGTGPVDLADPNAREILLDRLQHYKKLQEDYKAMNAWYRKHGTLKGYGDYTDEKAAEFDAAITKSIHQKPVPEYEFTSLRGKIKRTQERLDELDRLDALREQPEDETAGFDGGCIVRNVDENRLQILFDDIPAAELRAELKSSGFHWSPRNKAWQRQLTENAERDARRILGIA